MDTRLDFQRLLEDMDKVIQAKQQELDELDSRLEVSRTELSELEASELAKEAGKVQLEGGKLAAAQAATLRRTSSSNISPGQQHNLIHQQRQLYEEQLQKFGDELAELESINQELVSENKSLAARLNKSLRNNEDLQVKTSSLADKLEEALNANLELNLRLGRAEAEIKTQERLLKKTHDEDEVLMQAFGDKLESLKRTLEEKDEEIKRLRMDNQFALESFAMTIGKNEDRKTNHPSNKSDDSTLSEPDKHNYHDDEGVSVNPDTSIKQRVIRLVNEFKEKNSQVEQLKRQLLQATKDLEEKAILFESLNLEKAARPNDEATTVSDSSSGNMKELLARYEMLESEVEAKDRQLHLSEFRNNHYETILPDMIADLIQALLANLRRSSVSDDTTLSIEPIEALLSALEGLRDRLSSTRELLKKIDELKSVNYEKDARIEELVKELNELHEAVSNGFMTPSGEGNEAKGEVVRDKRKSVSFRQSSESLQKTEAAPDGATVHDDLSNLPCPQDRLQVQDQGNGRDTSESDGLPVMQSLQQQSSLNQHRELDNRAPEQVGLCDGARKAISQQSSEETPAQPNGNKLDRQKSKSTMTGGSSRPNSPDDTTDLNNALSRAQDRLKLLENENDLLELAMKEILLSLKWSDAKCNTLLIDCPSLERLCQLIEARFLSHTQESPSGELPVDVTITSRSLFQLVVLKSELDLLRGQNEELRSNAKARFKEHTDQLKIFSSEKATLAEQASQTDALPESEDVELKCKNCSKLTHLAKHLLQCIMRVETRLRESDEIYTSRLMGLHQVIQILEKELSNSKRELEETRGELNHQNQRKLSTDVRLQYIQDQLSFHLKFCSMSQMNSSHPRVGAENLQIYTAAKSGNGDSIESYTISQKTASHIPSQADPKIRDPRLTISMLQSIISCLQARIDFKDDRLRELEQLLASSSETTDTRSDAHVTMEQDEQIS